MDNDKTIKVSEIEHQKQMLRLEFKENIKQLRELESKLEQIKAQLAFADKLTGTTKSTFKSKDWLDGYEIPSMPNAGVSEALKILAEKNSTRSFTIAQLTDAMQRSGVVNSQSDNFKNTLYVTTKRLVEDGFLNSSMEGRYKTFFLKQKTAL